MADVHFTDNSVEVKEKLNNAITAWLYEVGGEVQAKAQRNSRVDTGYLKGSWDYKVDEGEQNVTVGSSLENAIWEEFGTGQYALNGDGRKTPWFYKDMFNKWHKTIGKKPNRTLHRAIDPMKGKIQKALVAKLKELNK